MRDVEALRWWLPGWALRQIARGELLGEGCEWAGVELWWAPPVAWAAPPGVRLPREDGEEAGQVVPVCPRRGAAR